ncbi:MAG: formylglycine-generating enzyme family protein [Cyanobacteria bacterium P01_F01_bin.143]
MSDRFSKLLETLHESELAMTSYELADMCWLLLNSPQIEEATENAPAISSEDKNKSEPKIRRERVDEKATEQVPSTQNEPEPPEKPVAEKSGELFTPQPQGQTAGNILKFPIDSPTDLGSSLGLARALRALLKKVPNLNRAETLDEIATVDSYAACNKAVLAPVFKPVMEPWLEIALVIDGNFSLDLWHQTIKDLILFFRNYGIFRDVQVWKLFAQENELSLYKGLEVNQGRISTPKELLNPNGRRIIIVLSDCVADYWHNGNIYDFLNQWQQTNLVAILQMLPEWLWLKTGLGDGAKVTLFSGEPGAKNSQLRIKEILLWEDVFADPKALKMPVFTLEAKSVERWSGLVAGLSDTKVAGFVLSPNNLEEFVAIEEPEEELDPDAIVFSFRNNSSPLAQELAELLASAPTIFLPVVRLIRRKILPEAGQVQIAEVFLGGLLRVSSDYPTSTDPDLVLYDFVGPEVRKILQKSSTRSASVNVFEEVSRYIAEQKGIELREFLAELKKPLENVDANLQDIIYPFAKVSKEILQTLGGDYARFAREELKAAGVGEKEKLEKYDFSGFPELEDLEYETGSIVLLDGIELLTQEFTVAEVEISILETFEFTVAKLEQQLNRNKETAEWEITEQKGEAQRLIEELNETVTLEMVLIPSGKFIMGAAPREVDSSRSERPQHEVKIQKAFMMGKYSITQEQWQAIMGNNPSVFKEDKRPVENISWYQAVEFCDRISQLTRREYRLPSEAEWEYACRAGTTTPFHFGETITTDLANYDGNYTYGEGVKGEYQQETTTVGKFEIANNFGLCDMHGNVWQWCLDHWHNDYKNAPSDGSAWVSGGKSNRRVLRGGSWLSNPNSCRSATRNVINPEFVSDVISFRVVCSVPRTR